MIIMCELGGKAALSEDAASSYKRNGTSLTATNNLTTYRLIVLWSAEWVRRVWRFPISPL